MSNAGDFTTGLAEVVKWSDDAYSVGRLLILFIIFFGLLYYLGGLSGEGYKLKKPSRFETDLRNYAQGLVFLIILLVIAAIIASVISPEMLSSPAIFVLFGLVEFVLIYLILFDYISQKEPARAIKKTRWREFREAITFGFFWFIVVILLVLLAFIIPILIIAKHPNQQQLFFNLSVLFVFILLIAYPFLSGRFVRPKEHEVSVYLFGGEKLENLRLYQTTDVDYRFRKGDEEIVIPISQVQKIVYTPPKEEQKSVSSDEKQGRSPKLRGG